MNPIVPFVHNLVDKDALVWLNTLQSAMPNINICQLDKLCEKEKKVSKLQS